ncbi:MAG: hypothetical protein IPK12_01515 [Gemmatimonadetes bacterium]|nr:hypothetical protein [Gemmatimonadota bacterium]
MRRTTLLAASCALLLLPTPGAAQRSADQARLVISVGLGQTLGGKNLWSVGAQPLQVYPGRIDTIAVQRAFRTTFNIDFSATYFPTPNLGFNAGATLLGLGTADACATGGSDTGGPVSDSTIYLCNQLDRGERSATSGVLSAGVVYRIAPHNKLYPYVRANAGLAISQQSFIRLRGTYADDSEKNIYNDPEPANTQPYFGFGGGIVAVLGGGYQFRFEVRDNWVRIPTVTGSTAGFTGGEPPTKTTGRHLVSVVAAFDVVLERKRGRRY